MITLASSTDLPMILHVGGAMVLVGALACAAVLLLAATRADGGADHLRVGMRTLLWGAIPAFVVMRVGAEWIASEMNVDDDAAWIGIGYITSDLGALLLIVATVLAAVASRRGTVGGGVRWAAGLSLLMIAAYAVTLWAMTAKPV